ncbi:hypothetical protein BASA61_000570 [Batrachochytrium salamandrivorans]|nr:hypothetical protein BASA61_000570 [Batrachochytrium salamandrivorans]
MKFIILLAVSLFAVTVNAAAIPAMLNPQSLVVLERRSPAPSTKSKSSSADDEEGEADDSSESDDKPPPKKPSKKYSKAKDGEEDEEEAEEKPKETKKPPPKEEPKKPSRWSKLWNKAKGFGKQTASNLGQSFLNKQGAGGVVVVVEKIISRSLSATDLFQLYIRLKKEMWAMQPL